MSYTACPMINMMSEIHATPDGEIQSVSDQLRQQMISKLDKLHQTHPIEEKRKQKQRTIIHNLPSDIFFEINALKYLPDTNEGTVAGFLFEELVRADNEICPSEETDVAKTLRSFMHNPERYSLEDIHPAKNPDLARINDQGTITGWVEVKAGKLNQNSINQLIGFEYSFRTMLERLKILSRKTLKEHGLSVIADKQKSLELSPNPIKILAVPNGSNDDNLEELLDDDQVKKITQKQKKELSKYKIVQSPFSRQELHELTGLFNNNTLN